MKQLFDTNLSTKISRLNSQFIKTTYLFLVFYILVQILDNSPNLFYSVDAFHSQTSG
jgi:hypothetical protein